MSYQLVNTIITPAGATPFDEWFDALPIDYFKNDPYAGGKNKFELLEDTLNPPPRPQRVVGNEIKVATPDPIVTKERSVFDSGEVHLVTISTWNSRYECGCWLSFGDVIYTNEDDIEMNRTLLRAAGPTIIWPEAYRITIDSNTNKFVVNSETQAYLLNTFGITGIDTKGEVYTRYIADDSYDFLNKKYKEIFNVTEQNTYAET